MDPARPLRLWVTRARPEAQATAARLIALGHGPLVSPLLAIRRLKPRLALEGVAALVFTSRNGVAAYVALETDRRRPVFAVGDATAEAARAAGFAHVRSAAGDVNALADLITSALITAAHDRASGDVLIAGAREPAGDLPGALNAAGLQTRSAAVYAAVPAPGRRGLKALSLGKLDGVLIHSPRAARRFAVLAASAPVPAEALSTLRAFCISEAAAAPLRPLGLGRVAVAASPDEAALLSLLGKPAAPV